MISIKKITIAFIFVLSFGLNAQTRIYNFNAIPLGDSVRINFTILQASVTCAGYQILKRNDSLTLNPIYVYPGICGTTSSNEIYNYTDFSPNKLTPNFYQVHIPPNDYSVVKRVDLAASFSNLLIYPQPVEDFLNIAISGQKNYSYEITIFDRFGRKKGFGSGGATDKFTLDVSGFAEGVYVFYIVTNNAGNYRGKFLKKPKGN
ncbi:MAG: T9SS type A sorting domain-containing protein [Sphingobacteriaceae bacterium]|nr:T9SS type A sorting domain-containing protein [Sphingobacteriaceae bacterium]